MRLSYRFFIARVSTVCWFMVLFLNMNCAINVNSADNVENPLSHTEKLVLTNPDSAFLLIQQLRKKYSDTGDEHSLAICYQQLGRILHYQGAYSQALVFYFKADKTFRKEHDQLLLAQNSNNIGQTYSSVMIKEKALLMYQAALKIFNEERDNKGIAQTYNLLGQLYQKKDSYDRAFQYQSKALEIYNRLGDSSGIARVYNNIGAIYEHTQRYDEAFNYLNRALAINKATHNQLAQISIINNIGDVYRKTGKLKNAIETTMQAKKLAVGLKNKRQLLSACDDLSQTYKLLGNSDSAYFYSEAASKIYHATFKEESSKQINLLQTLFEVEQKDSEIVQLKSDKNLTLISTGAVIAICLLLILLVFSILSKQKLKSQDEKIILEAQKNLMEIELQNKLLQENKLHEALDIKSKELTSHTLHIIQKNQLLDDLKSKLNAIIKSDKRDQRKEIKQLVNLINMNSNQDKNWNDFRIIFEQVHINFFTDLKKYSDLLTSADLRLLALLKMNLSSADIATMIGISQDSLRTSKYRLRQKLQLTEGETLLGFIQQL